MAVTEIQGARFAPSMDSFLGSAKGVLDALGAEQPFEQLWGLSGLAYRMQVHRSLAPAGLLPPQWDLTYAAVFRRLGWECIAGLRDHFYTEDDLPLLRLGWRRNIGEHLERGLPAIAFGLHGPAFGIIRGLDTEREAYLVSTLWDGLRDEPISAQALGSAQPACLFVLIPLGPLESYTPAAACGQGLLAALAQARGEEVGSQGAAVVEPPDLASGARAYEVWSQAIAGGVVDPPWGAAWTAGYYLEARTLGSAFLAQAGADWFPEKRTCLAEAARRMGQEAGLLRRLAGLFPPAEPALLEDVSRREQAVGLLQAAQEEYRGMLEVLAEFGADLG